MEIPFHGQIDVGAVRRMNRAILIPSRRTLIIAVVVVLVMLWGVVIFPFLQGQEVRFDGMWPIVLFVLLFVGILGFGIMAGPKKLLQSSVVLQSPITGVASETGVRMETAHSTTELPWDVFLKRKIDKDVVLLYQSIHTVNLFPREFFGSEGDWQAFVDLVRQRVPEKAPAARGGKPSKLAVFWLWLAIFVVVILLWNVFHK